MGSRDTQRARGSAGFSRSVGLEWWWPGGNREARGHDAEAPLSAGQGGRIRSAVPSSKNREARLVCMSLCLQLWGEAQGPVDQLPHRLDGGHLSLLRKGSGERRSNSLAFSWGLSWLLGSPRFGRSHPPRLHC